MRLHAVIEINAVAQSHGDVLCRLDVHQPRLTHYDREQKGHVPGYSDDSLEQRLASQFYFTHTPHGQIVELWHQDGAPAWAVNLKRGILSALQITHDINSNATSYVTEETDITGICHVSYDVDLTSRRTAFNPGLKITRICNAYTRMYSEIKWAAWETSMRKSIVCVPVLVFLRYVYSLARDSRMLFILTRYALSRAVYSRALFVLALLYTQHLWN
jgi:hypothetical protein